MNKVELLAPAGSLDRLKIAILYGADAVYIGGKRFSLRARANNFTIDDIKEACSFALIHNVKVYVTMNIVPHNEDMSYLEDYLLTLESLGITGIIVSSVYIMQTAKRITPMLEIHLSTQLSITNSMAVQYFENYGVKRVVLAREVSLEQIQKIKQKTNIELEVFIHGGMCVSYSGRCMLSNYMTRRDANRGGCAHSCRWNYKLFDDALLHDEDINFNLGSKDLCAISATPKLIDLGIASLKIEGRMKSAYYLATVIRSYRKLIDEYYLHRSLNEERIDYYYNEIKKSENRLMCSGFLLDFPDENQQLYNIRNEMPTKEFVGMIIDYDTLTGIALVEQRNFFEIGDRIEFFGPILENTIHIIDNITDIDGNDVDIARHPQQILKIKLPFKVNKFDMMRKIIK